MQQVFLYVLLSEILPFQVLVTKSSPAQLYILRPLTSESATLSGLCLGETLGLEKRLGEASKESSPKKRIPTVENKPWDQLIARALQHKSQSTGTSTHPTSKYQSCT